MSNKCFSRKPMPQSRVQRRPAMIDVDPIKQSEQNVKIGMTGNMGDMNYEEALRIVEGRRGVVQQCSEELKAVLEKYRCVLVPRIEIQGNQIVASSVAIMPNASQQQVPIPPQSPK